MGGGKFGREISGHLSVVLVGSKTSIRRTAMAAGVGSCAVGEQTTAEDKLLGLLTEKAG
jgi:hypothetical protein